MFRERGNAFLAIFFVLTAAVTLLWSSSGECQKGIWRTWSKIRE